MTDHLALLWDNDTPAKEYVEVPAWVLGRPRDDEPGRREPTCSDVAAICQGGCASGAWMPAVTYWEALETMAEHGDEVLQYIEDQYGEIPELVGTLSWGGLAVHYLSTAVELWASSVQEELVEALGGES